MGHRNPDTDSICSSISYAYLKNKKEGLEEMEKYIPKRVGQINEETHFVLDYFNVPAPEYIDNVGAQVSDLEIRQIQGVSSAISVKTAWDKMSNEDVVTLPVVDDQNHLQGLIVVEDIATSYMNLRDNKALGIAKTPYVNIIATLNGEMVVGNIEDVFDRGNVLIAAANPDLMEEYIKPHDMVVTGNRYESQLSAIEMKADCLIVCDGAKISVTIQKLAQQNNCHIISTPYDTFTVARLIYQSIPIDYFMRRRDLVTFKINDYTNDVKEVMAKKRYRDFPILDDEGRLLGMISRRNLLETKRKQIILVDHNEVSQAVKHVEEADILEIIDHHRIGTLETMGPVYFRNQPVGCTATILFQIFQEEEIVIEPRIAGLLCSAIISDTLMFRSPTCTPMDVTACKTLANIAGIQIEEYAKKLFRAGSNMSNKTPEEIMYQDFKRFTVGKKTFGVGQINSLDVEELAEIKEMLQPYLEVVQKESGLDCIFFMLTNILSQSTILIFTGEEASRWIEDALHTIPDSNSCYLKGIVSRKKQLIPALVSTLQE